MKNYILSVQHVYKQKNTKKHCFKEILICRGPLKKGKMRQKSMK